MGFFLQELVAMLQALRKGRYPGFVVPGGFRMQTPVFLYHKVYPSGFRQHLSHLLKNGYSTLTVDEYYRALTEGGPGKNRSVVLTFDDGIENLHTVVYPLLREYGFKAVAFILPAWIGKPGMITREQVKEMHGSGLIDFQSHSFRHSLIFTSDKIVDFFRGGQGAARSCQVPWDLPMIRKNKVDRLPAEGDMGIPIFTTASRMSGSRRFLPDEGLNAACVETVRNHGQMTFFEKSAWKKRLREVCRKYGRSRGGMGRYETREEQREAIREELTLSRRAIEEMLPEKSVRHFSFPWLQSGNVAMELMKECGYRSAYVGLPAENREFTPEERIYRLFRVDGDFVPCLPGSGRSSLFRVMFLKLARRLLKGRRYW